MELVNSFHYGRAQLLLADCIEWLKRREPLSIQAVVTDPPYGLVEYSPKEQRSSVSEEAVFGEFHRHSMAISVHRCRASLLLHPPTSNISNRFLPRGRNAWCGPWSPALMS